MDRTMEVKDVHVTFSDGSSKKYVGKCVVTEPAHSKWLELMHQNGRCTLMPLCNIAAFNYTPIYNIDMDMEDDLK